MPLEENHLRSIAGVSAQVATLKQDDLPDVQALHLVLGVSRKEVDVLPGLEPLLRRRVVRPPIGEHFLVHRDLRPFGGRPQPVVSDGVPEKLVFPFEVAVLATDRVVVDPKFRVHGSLARGHEGRGGRADGVKGGLSRSFHLFLELRLEAEKRNVLAEVESCEDVLGRLLAELPRRRAPLLPLCRGRRGQSGASLRTTRPWARVRRGLDRSLGIARQRRRGLLHLCRAQK
mmetsp:Transcript_35071/g.76000  ORF Transcript_35071/g.76000 Transcript_35071/m.76000 type:complete len:230 (+) Transcript_35071:1080-1769(+)